MSTNAVLTSGRARLLGAAAVASALVVAGGCRADPPQTGQAAAQPTTQTAQSEAQPQAQTRMEPLNIVTGTGVRSFSVEIAADEDSREQGLMFRKSLAPDRGMLFEFDQASVQSFWMKNTLIPLDIIYIGADGRIVSISRQARPLDETPLFSTGPAIGVLEIEGGLSEKLGIQPGDKVEHPFFHPK